MQCASEIDEIRTIANDIARRRERGVEWSQMVVLYGHPETQKKLYSVFTSLNFPYFNVAFNRTNKVRVMSAGNVLRTATYQLLKGLEFSVVYVCGVNKIFEAGASEDDSTRRRLVYVALTRAMDELFVTVSGNGPIGQALIDAHNRLSA